ncbi:hypothetical protein HanHA300_Chr17g0665121 [Helianthus annuus]|nr:hypothetical protein HanHA300_Chr17g0665121 [Helianthus annuus]
MVLPLLKLGTLALKTLSKPIAKRLKQQAAIHPKFRTSIIGFAQFVDCRARFGVDKLNCCLYGFAN